MENHVLNYLSEYYKKGASYSDLFFNQVKKALDGIKNPLFKKVKFEKQFFTKSRTSLARSIVDTIQSINQNVKIPKDFNSITAFNVLIDKSLSSLSDFFRINICIDDDADFTEESIRLLKSITKIPGISINVKKSKPFKNSFKIGGGCKDFKIYFLYKDYPFEVQLHNKSSEDINLNTHGIYEVYRAKDLRLDYKKLLAADRAGLYSLVKPPIFNEEAIIKRGINYA